MSIKTSQNDLCDKIEFLIATISKNAMRELILAS